MVDDLGVAGDELNVRFATRLGQRPDDPPQIVHRQAFFEDEGRRKVEWDRTADRQIVHRAVHSQTTDVAAGEEQGPDHERVGGESQPRGGMSVGRRAICRAAVGRTARRRAERNDGLIFQRVQDQVAQLG